MKILFLGKKNDPHCDQALQFTRRIFPDVTVRLGVWGEKFDEGLCSENFDIVISYLSRWIVPSDLLKRSDVAINFHPASPDYPGIGCNNFALYHEAEEFGATCHFMKPAVDTGDIIATKQFAIYAHDDVASLLRRTYDFQLTLFYEVIGRLAHGEELKPSGEKWGRKAFTRKQFNELATLTPDMSEREIKRRIRACAYREWRPQLHLHGISFEPK